MVEGLSLIDSECLVTLLCSVLRVNDLQEKRISGANGCKDPPVPIPNTEVKLTNAEDTWLATTWENRTVPEHVTAVKET